MAGRVEDGALARARLDASSEQRCATYKTRIVRIHLDRSYNVPTICSFFRYTA
jgi:hypothetical protein